MNPSKILHFFWLICLSTLLVYNAFSFLSISASAEMAEFWKGENFLPSLNKNLPIAQEGGVQWNPFRSLRGLFKKRNAVPKAAVQEPKKQRRTAPASSTMGGVKQKTPSSTKSDAPSKASSKLAPPLHSQPKAADAWHVLVLGGALAEGLAKGLERRYAQIPQLEIFYNKLPERNKKISNISTNEDNLFIVEEIKKSQADLVVILPPLIQAEHLSLKEGVLQESEAWASTLRLQIALDVAAVRNHYKPLIWVGLPPVKAPDLSKKIIYANKLYREQVTPAGAVFVDLWPVFSDLSASYTPEGPDLLGVPALLRTSDGIHFTWRGYEKMAFFVEKEIALLLGEGSARVFETAAQNPDLVLLTNPYAGTQNLLGESQPRLLPWRPGSIEETLFVHGRALRPVPGRADAPSPHSSELANF